MLQKNTTSYNTFHRYRIRQRNKTYDQHMGHNVSSTSCVRSRYLRKPNSGHWFLYATFGWTFPSGTTTNEKEFQQFRPFKRKMNTNELKEYTGRVPVFILKAYDMVQLSHEKYFDTLCW